MTEKTYIENLITKINNSSGFFVIAEENGYFVVGTAIKLKVRVENSNNIFRPLGKNVDKHLPIYFPVIFDMKKAKPSDIVYSFHEFKIPLLHLNKRQIKMDTLNIEFILQQYINENFRK